MSRYHAKDLLDDAQGMDVRGAVYVDAHSFYDIEAEVHLRPVGMCVLSGCICVCMCVWGCYIDFVYLVKK